MSKRYLITGCNGQLGCALRERYPDAYSVSHESLDISNEKQVESIDWSKYDVIINAAAYVSADHSETPDGIELTWQANAVGPRNLTKVAIKYGLHLVHISSEYVFDGTKANHQEDEPFTPLSVYGQTKSAGDIAVSLVPKNHILRTSWVIGDGHNFAKTMKELADKGINPKVVNDQYGRLTFTSEIVRAIDHIIDNKVGFGTYNLSNSGKVKSWFEIAGDVFEYAGYDRERVEPITTVEYMRGKTPFAPRPTHSDMDLSKIRRTGFVNQDYEPLLLDYVQNLPYCK